MAGRQSVTAYTVFFDVFVPCATKKTLWETRLGKALSTFDADASFRKKESAGKRMVSLCSVSDEAFALLLLENSFDRWLDLHLKRKGAANQRRGGKERGYQSEVRPLYTRGGIKYEHGEGETSVKGWSDQGRKRFNALFDLVKKDRLDNPSFEMNWLKARHEAKEKNGRPKKMKRKIVVTRSELFDSDEEEEGSQESVSKCRLGAADDPGSDEES